jgi:hypothetical protein
VTVLATIEDLANRYDERTLGQFATDEDDLVLTRDEILEHPKLLQIMSSAAGRVKAALLCGERYKPEQLESLTGDDREFLVELVCTCAMARIFGRRPGLHEDQAKACNAEVDAYLEQLRQGKNLFNLPSHRTAANPTFGGPTVVQLQNTNLAVGQCMGRHYPSQDQFLPRDRG